MFSYGLWIRNLEDCPYVTLVRVGLGQGGYKIVWDWE